MVSTEWWGRGQSFQSGDKRISPVIIDNDRVELNVHKISKYHVKEVCPCSPWVGLGLRDDVHDGDKNKKQAQLTVVFHEWMFQNDTRSRRPNYIVEINLFRVFNMQVVFRCKYRIFE